MFDISCFTEINNVSIEYDYILVPARTLRDASEFLSHESNMTDDLVPCSEEETLKKQCLNGGECVKRGSGIIICRFEGPVQRFGVRFSSWTSDILVAQRNMKEKNARAYTCQASSHVSKHEWLINNYEMNNFIDNLYFSLHGKNLHSCHSNCSCWRHRLLCGISLHEIQGQYSKF